MSVTFFDYIGCTPLPFQNNNFGSYGLYNQENKLVYVT